MDTNRMGTPDWPRFLKYVKKQDGCWLWTGAIRGNGRNEYGAFWAKGTQRAHIVSYVWTYGEPNADLHHTCGQGMCVNPEHVTPASAGQYRHRNVIPGLCARGHEFTVENTHISPTGQRVCRTCKRLDRAAYVEANREKVNAARRGKRVRVQEPRPCKICGEMFTPKKYDAIYCKKTACYNAQQRINRLKRLEKARQGK